MPPKSSLIAMVTVLFWQIQATSTVTLTNDQSSPSSLS